MTALPTAQGSRHVRPPNTSRSHSNGHVTHENTKEYVQVTTHSSRMPKKRRNAASRAVSNLLMYSSSGSESGSCVYRQTERDRETERETEAERERETDG